MSKVTLQTIANLDNPNSATAQLNNNFAILQDIIDLLLSRDGTSPNTMAANLDMNGYRILDLPSPTTNTEPARHGDIQQYVTEAANSASEAAVSADDADAKDTAVTSKWTDFLNRYVGAYSVAPTQDAAGNPLSNGSMYFDTGLDNFNIYNKSSVVSDNVLVVSQSVQVVDSHWIVFPSVTLRSLNDVSAASITQGQTLVWNEGVDSFIPFDLSTAAVSAFVAGLTSSNEIVFKMVVPFKFALQNGTNDNQAKAGKAAASSTVYTLYRNSISVGTCTFAANSTDGVFDVTDTNSFIVGDQFKIVGPTSADTALSDIAFTFIVARD